MTACAQAAHGGMRTRDAWGDIGTGHAGWQTHKGAGDDICTIRMGGRCTSDTWSGICRSHRATGEQQMAQVATCAHATQGDRCDRDPCDDMRTGQTEWHAHARHMG